MPYTGFVKKFIKESNIELTEYEIILLADISENIPQYNCKERRYFLDEKREESKNKGLSQDRFDFIFSILRDLYYWKRNMGKKYNNHFL